MCLKTLDRLRDLDACRTSEIFEIAQRPDCVAGHVRFELGNVVANYPFEKSHKFAGIQPNSGDEDQSRLSCGAGDTQLGRSAIIPRAASSRTLWSSICIAERTRDCRDFSADPEMIRRRQNQQHRAGLSSQRERVW
jgi:hypothetical protein